ncbi:MAG: DUF1559 domain-containing protein [Armatimonadia bacterium]
MRQNDTCLLFFSGYIIAILAAILFPVFAKAREKARQTSCLNNLKQLSLGMIQYTQDYDERFPLRDSGRIAGAYGSGPVPGAPDFNWVASWSSYQDTWINKIYPYVKNTQVYRCPSGTPAPIGCDYGTPDCGYTTTPAVAKIDLFRAVPPPSLGQFTRPAETMLVTEKLAGGNPQYVLMDQYYACDARHNEGGNLAFVDGHAKWMKFSTSSLVSCGFPAPYNAASSVHPPEETFRNPFN